MRITRGRNHFHIISVVDAVHKYIEMFLLVCDAEKEAAAAPAATVQHTKSGSTWISKKCALPALSPIHLFKELYMQIIWWKFKIQIMINGFFVCVLRIFFLLSLFAIVVAGCRCVSDLCFYYLSVAVAAALMMTTERQRHWWRWAAIAAALSLRQNLHKK